MNWEGQERKKFPRAAFPCKIVIGHAHKTVMTQTENIGKGGIKILLEEELEHSSIVALELDIVKGKPIKCEGQIVWVRKIPYSTRSEVTIYSIGIMFTTISEEDRKYLKHFVEHLLVHKGK